MGKSRGGGRGGVRRDIVRGSSANNIVATNAPGTIAEYESRVSGRDLPYETAFVVDAQGKATFLIGQSGSVSIPAKLDLKNAMVSHFHPAGENQNVTLSGQDVLMTLRSGAAGIRATTATGHVMTFLNKTPGNRRPGDAMAFAQAYDREWGRARDAFIAKHATTDRRPPGSIAKLEAEYRRLHRRVLTRVVRSLGYGVSVDRHDVGPK